MLPEEKALMENQLKNIITSSFEQNTTWTTDWDNFTLPIIAQRLAREKQQQQQQQHKKITKDQKIIKEKRKPGKPSVAIPNPSRETKRKLSSNLTKVSSSDVEANDGQSSLTFNMKEDPSRKEKRLKRFEREHKFASSPNSSAVTTSSPVSDLQPIVGRSCQLEKRYLRLTSAPDPDMVRPLHILKQTLDLLKDKWRQEQNYSYICDQFKSMRQDLTVQHIENEFTVLVYEIHARIALEKGDLGEYNQCQSRLKELYNLGIPGKSKEFLAYRLLYLLHTQNKAEISHILVQLDAETLAEPCVKHALQVVSAMTQANHHRLFKLYIESPNMGGYVMDSFIARERLTALSIICRCYRPDVSIDVITTELGFADRDDCLDFLQTYHVANHIFFSNDVEKFTTKDAFIKIENARQAACKKVDIKGQI